MLWVLIRIASRGNSYEYPQHMFLWKTLENDPLTMFLWIHKNICCGYSLESPWRGDSNEYPQHMFLWINKKNYLKIITKYSLYLFHCSLLIITWSVNVVGSTPAHDMQVRKSCYACRWPGDFLARSTWLFLLKMHEIISEGRNPLKTFEGNVPL